MFKEYETKKRQRLEFLLPWSYIEEESIILNKNGSLQSTFTFRGQDLDSCTNEELTVMSERFNNVFKRLKNNWAISVDTVRSRSKKYNRKSGIKKIPTFILETERESFFKSGHHFENTYYLTFIYFLPTDKIKKLTKLGIKKDEVEKDILLDFEEDLKFYKRELEEIYGLLSSALCSIRLLSSQEMISFYHSCVNDTKLPISVPQYNCLIDNYICNSPLVGGLEPKLGENFIRVISIRNFPSESVPCLLDKLNRTNIEYRWNSRYIALDKIEANKSYDWYTKEWNKKKSSLKSLTKEILFKERKDDDDYAIIQIDELRRDKIKIEADLTGLGYYTVAIIIEDKAFEEADRKALEIKTLFNSMGFTAEIEEVNTLDSFIGSIPGNVACNCRRPPLNSISLVHLLPVSSVWAGNEYNNHLKEPALIYTQTSGNTPFRLNLHYNDVGHTLIVGPTGTGKSVLLATIEAHFLKYTNAQVFAFDKGGSSRVLTVANGGKFYDLGTGNIRFQPLRNCDSNMEWCQQWIEDILTINEELPLNPTKKHYITEALKAVANLPLERRTLSAFVSFIGGQDNLMKQALSQYAGNGIYAKYFDGNEDFIEEADFITFEMEDILNVNKAVVPTLSYLFHRIETEKLNGRPTLLPLDECWIFLSHKTFAPKIREWLKVLRKKNASVVFATQSLSDIANSDILSAVLDSCYSRIYLANPTASEQKELYKTFGLNDREIEIIKYSTPKRQYYFKSVEGNRLFELGLSPLELSYVAASSYEDQEKCKELAHLSTEEFNKEWLKYKGFDGELYIENVKRLMAEESEEKK